MVINVVCDENISSVLYHIMIFKKRWICTVTSISLLTFTSVYLSVVISNQLKWGNTSFVPVLCLNILVHMTH